MWIEQRRIGSFADAVSLMAEQIQFNTGPFKEFFRGIDEYVAEFGGSSKLIRRIKTEIEAAGIDWDTAVGDSSQYIWITAFINSCCDCIVRHGLKGPLSAFNIIGLPRSGFSICGCNCQCQLISLNRLKLLGISVEDLLRPVIQLKKQLTKECIDKGFTIIDIEAVIKSNNSDKIKEAFERLQRRKQNCLTRTIINGGD